MKKNIKIKRLVTIYLSLILTSSLTTFTYAKTKYIPKSIIKTNKNNSIKKLNNILNKTNKKKLNKKNSTDYISKNLNSLLSNINDKPLILNENEDFQLPNFQMPVNSTDKPIENVIINCDQEINLKFSSGDRLLNGVALWFINDVVMKEIYNKLNITEKDREGKTTFFEYVTNTDDPKLNVTLSNNDNETFNKAKNNLEKYLKNNFKNMCQSLARSLRPKKVYETLKEIKQQIPYEISNIESEIRKINDSSINSRKEYYITKGQQFFESEKFKYFVEFINPDLYEFLKIKLNEPKNEKHKKNIFSTIGKEIAKKELENLRSKLTKMNNLKSNFSRFIPKDDDYSYYDLFDNRYNSYFDYDYNYSDYDRRYYDDSDYDYHNSYRDYFDNDYDDENSDYNSYKYRSYKKMKREEKRICEITKNLARIIGGCINFKNLRKENVETLNENKKEYEKYMKNLKIILDNINLNKKQENNSGINSNSIEFVVGKLKNDRKLIRKILKNNKKKSSKKELKNEMEKILNCLHLSKTFEENKEKNNSELIKLAKEWLPIKIKYIKKILSDKNFKNIKGEIVENQNTKETNSSDLNAVISQQSTMDETDLNVENSNVPILQTTKKIKNNNLKKTTKLKQ